MITGVDTPLGRRVARRVAQDPGVRVVGLAGGPVAGLPAEVDVRLVDLRHDDVKPHLEHAAALLHLATSVPASPTAATDDVDVARRVLDAAGTQASRTSSSCRAPRSTARGPTTPCP